jgi:hypothetical protein
MFNLARALLLATMAALAIPMVAGAIWGDWYTSAHISSTIVALIVVIALGNSLPRAGGGK